MPSHPTHKKSVRRSTLRHSCTMFCILFAVLLFAASSIVSAAPVPQITGISPAGGPVDGKTPVTVTGSGFSGSTSVMFGEKAATSLKVLNDSVLTVVAPPHSAGSVPVSVTSEAGTGSTSVPPLLYSYEESPLPRLSYISPASGPCDKSVTVTLTGSGFIGTEEVWFGDRLGHVTKITDDSHMEVQSPRASPGVVVIRLRNAHGSQPLFDPEVTYTCEYPLPEITGVSPSSGPTHGGTVVTITGSGLSGTTGVRFGNVFGKNLTVVNDNQLTIVLPPNPSGTVAVYVINPVFSAGSSDAKTVFRYEIPIPRLTGVSPKSGPVDGGTNVTLTGSGFMSTRNVLFGKKPGTHLEVIDDNHLTVISPPSRPGSFPISISNAYGEGGSLGPDTLFRFEFPVQTLTPVTLSDTTGPEDTDRNGTDLAITSPPKSPELPATPGTTQKTADGGAAVALSVFSVIILFGAFRR